MYYGTNKEQKEASKNIKSATPIGNGGKKRHREESIESLLHDATEFAKDKLGKDYKDDDTVEIKFCDLVNMLKDYESDGNKKN